MRDLKLASVDGNTCKKHNENDENLQELSKFLDICSNKQEKQEVEVTYQDSKMTELVEAPIHWTYSSLQIVGSKYFRGKVGTPERETSVFQLIKRVVLSISYGGLHFGHYTTLEIAKERAYEVFNLLVNQDFAYNSPVWFNLGHEVNPQCSACFIVKVEDSMKSILNWYVEEGMIFKKGSGAGTNLSNIRGSKELLKGGGSASGPISFMAGADASAGGIKSGGKCLPSNQHVLTEVGPIQVKDLVDKEFIVLSYDPTQGRYKAKRAQAWKSGNKKIVEVTTDKGVFRTSFDHPYRLRTGEARMACDLKVGNSLFSSSVNVTKDGYVSVHLKNGNKGKEFMHRMVARDVLEKDIDGKVVHHIDGNKLTNTISNLSVMGQSSHAMSHCVDLVGEDNHRVLKIEELPSESVYSVEVFCPTEDDKSPESGHNYVIWSNNSISDGCGVAVFNTRRAAKMVLLNDNHPDILEFIHCKYEEEKKAHALIEAGYSADFTKKGSAYDSVKFQNANHSVKLSDEFMKRATAELEEDQQWDLINRTDGSVSSTVNAKDMLLDIAKTTWFCGDPGVQFSDAIEIHNKVGNIGKINASNPCSEYLFLDDTSCNLASINLMNFTKKTVHDKGKFNVDIVKLRRASAIILETMDIIVSVASYPTDKIKEQTQNLRPLGIGFANLGSFLMSHGIPYDSDEGRKTCGYIMYEITKAGWGKSVEMAELLGAFAGYSEQHFKAAFHKDAYCPEKPVRNAQISVLAPTGTIAFMMGCDTTGIEPDFALVKYKMLVGGGGMYTVNKTVEAGLRYLGYDERRITKLISILMRVDDNGMLLSTNESDFVNAIDTEHKSVFATAAGFDPIHWEGHLGMMAAAQPHICGAISKTVNMIESSTIEEIRDAYVRAWKMKLKCVAIYRAGSKKSQPLSTIDDVDTSVIDVTDNELWGYRRKPTNKRNSITKKFTINGNDGYLTVGLFPDGKPCELFVTMNKMGTTVRGFTDAWASACSVILQLGGTLEDLVRMYSFSNFEPAGFTGEEEIRTCTSIVDYVVRWMELEFREEMVEPKEISGISDKNLNKKSNYIEANGAPCSNCGTLTTPNGSCWVCPACGDTTGCG